MSDFSIGLSGLKVAQRAIELIGTNVANADTAGYHRQEVLISPAGSQQTGTVLASGVTMTVRQIVDRVVERQMMQQQSIAGQADETLGLLQTIQASFGELENQPLLAAIDSFFGSLTQLSSQPDSLALREQTLWAAEQMAEEFRSRSSFLGSIATEVRSRATDLISEANAKITEIADLNMQMKVLESQGQSVNMLRDRRDEAVQELSQLIDVRVDSIVGGSGDLRVYGWDGLLVAGGRCSQISASSTTGGALGLAVGDDLVYHTDLRGGKLGAMLDLANNIIPGLQEQLDTLAVSIAGGINAIQVQGLSSQGPFTQLTGQTTNVAGPISGWSDDVHAGTFYIRVTDSDSGQITRHAVAVDPAVDTMAGVATKIAAVDNLAAWVADGKLHIQADDGYAFDFTPALLPQAQTAASADVEVAGLYEGGENETITITAQGAGQIGVTDGLKMEVTNASGEVLGLFNVGSGYAVGDPIDIGNGIRIRLGADTLADGDTFQIEAFSSSDSSGFLAAAGLNTLFSARSASDITVNESIMDRPELLAASRGMDGNDAQSFEMMADFADTKLESLGALTPGDYCRQLLTDVGRQVAAQQVRRDSTDKILQQLTNHRDSVSGVDVNEESAKLLVFERMYQAVARFINVQNDVTKYLMEIM